MKFTQSTLKKMSEHYMHFADSESAETYLSWFNEKPQEEH
jgi:hypothetical protein